MYDASIIVPAHNEEKILEESIRAIDDVMGKTKYSYELIFVDDCSSDGTREVIRNITRGRSNSQQILHEENQGKGACIVDGVKASKARVVGFLDVDLEVSAKYLPEFISAIDEGYDLAIGQRIYAMVPTIHNITRYIMSIVYGFLVLYYLRLPVQDAQCGFKFFNRESMLPLIAETEERTWFWDTEILFLAHKKNKRIKEVTCAFRRRRDKKSSLNLWRCVWLMLLGLRKLKGRMANE